MKRLFASVLAVLGLGTSAQAPKVGPASVMSEMRAKALSVKPADIGLTSAAYADKPWGVLMETGVDNGAAYSLVVLADGSTSLYFSTGGGVIGAGQHASVRAASKAMLEVAARLQTQATLTFATPLPTSGKVNFYLLSGKGTLAYSAAEQVLGDGKDRMSELFYAGHAVIGAVREAEQSRSSHQ